jgi:hypothetical protein
MNRAKWYSGEIEPSFKSWTHTHVRMQNGDIYKGTIIRGQRSGYGVYRVVGEDPRAQELVNWTEYEGEWRNDKPNGYGIMRHMRGDGLVRIIHDGEWINGYQSEVWTERQRQQSKQVAA